jgi:uncharacterized damage-inducible protein DinB
MSIIPMLLKELEFEAATTRKMLSRVPDDQFNWQPHDKSMTLQKLTSHIAELPGWISLVLTTSELDFAKNEYEPTPVKNRHELIEFFERAFEDGRSKLANATEDDLLPTWTMRNGDEIYDVSTKAEVIRMTYCQIVHHRAQLGVYLRLLNIPIPGSYGPSADEMDHDQGKKTY